jgi:hypothetical protein
MEVSTSQLVPTAIPSRAPRPPVSPNDVSVWKQVVVGTADFAPPPTARSGPGRGWIIAGAIGAILLGSGGAYAWYRLSRDAPASAPAATAGSAAVTPPTSPAVTTGSAPAKPDEPAPPAAGSGSGSGSAAAAGEGAAAGDGAAAEPAADEPAEPVEPTWLESFASSLSSEPTWLGELAFAVASSLVTPPANAKKPATPIRRTAATPAPKKPTGTPKKPAPKKPAPPSQVKRRP